jgi:DNA-binding protein YbaB
VKTWVIVPWSGPVGGGTLGFMMVSGTQRLDAWMTAFAEKEERTRRLAERVSALEVTATDPEGAIQVTVEASGAVRDLVLGDEIRGWRPDRLAAEILAVMRSAQREAGRRIERIAEETVGSGSLTGKAFAAEYAKLLGGNDGYR